MKLEVGKYYRTRGGRKAGPLKDFDGSFKGRVEDDRVEGNRVWYKNGSHYYGEMSLDLISEWEDEMKITMDGKYAYRKDPFTQVRILCVDRPGSWTNVVISMDAYGTTRGHTPTGVYDCGINPDWDLVPLQEKLPELWVNIYTDGNIYTYTDEGLAKRSRGSSPYGKTVKYIPAPDQTS